VQPSDSEAARRVDDYMNALWQARRYGGTVLVARGSRVLLARGYGLANAELGVANGPETVFRIGSLTKQLTAAGILLLRERGRLGLDDPVCRHLADCPSAWQPITIRNLLTHTSGIANLTALPEWATIRVQPATPAQTVARFSALPLGFSPGERFDYSNSNYILLGVIIERISGETYAEFMRRNVFEPLGMRSTSVTDAARIVRGRAAGYARNGPDIVNASYADPGVPFAAGGVESTVGDLRRWDQALAAPGFLSRESLEAMFTPLRDDYALGWGVGPLFGHACQGHTGGIEGFSSHISRCPADRVTVIVLMNNEAAVANVIAHDLAAILFGHPYQVPRQHRRVRLDPAASEAYPGRYEIAPGTVLTIRREGARLTVSTTPGETAEIIPESPNEFFLEVVDATISFVRDGDGRITGLVLHQNGQDIAARRLSEPAR
jgi:CubicO group peptidase (beta-lactamase class C family)